MDKTDMVFYGASGHGKVIIEAFLESGGIVGGIVDDNPEIQSLLDYRVTIGYSPGTFKEETFLVSIGDNCTRKRIAQSLGSECFGIVKHPRSVISPTASLGMGTVVMALAVVNASTIVGEHVILNTGSVVEHDAHISDFVHISPNATICGGVYIGQGTHVGANATVIQNISVGKWATIGAGAVITRDVPDYAVVVGCPGIIKKFNPQVQ